jgi:TonB-dependent starch-binding outer membrane protein SusC
MKIKPKSDSNFLLFVMKVTLLNVLITSMTIVLGYSLDSNGQEVLDQKLSLRVENADVKEVLAEIEDKIEVNFTYRPRLLKKVKNISLDATAVPLREILDQIFVPDIAIEYEVVGKQIILVDKTAHDAVVPVADPSIVVTGQTTDENGEALPGVNILEKGTANGTTSDAGGKFSLEVDENATLVFSFIGYETQEVPVGNQTSMNIKLLPDIKALEEVVVVGYGEQKKVTVTGSVVAVGGAELMKSPAVDLSNSFAGRLAGVVAVQTSGEPGFDQSTIRIRGVNSIGRTDPLVVIDGIPERDGGLNRLSPQEVESISVLKDASAAIYGSRAANGVILVTTKRGKTGAPKISYDFNQGWSQPTRIPEMSNAAEYASIMNEIPIYKNIPSSEWGSAWDAIQTTGTFTSPSTGTTVNANYSPDAVQKYRDHSDPWGYPDTDWFGDAFKKWSPQSRHNLSLSGGTENLSYFTTLGYVNQDAYYRNSATYYKQYNMRVNLDAKINKYISANLGLMAREEARNFPTQSAGSIFRMLMRGRPTEPEIWPNGLPGPDIENGQNPIVITTNATGYDRQPTDYLQSNGKVEITNPWIDGLKLTLMASVDRTLARRKMWETPWYLYTWDRVSYETDGVTPKLTKALRSTFSDARLTQEFAARLSTNLTGLLNYDKTFGDHTVGVLVGVTKEKSEGDFISAYRREYISTAIDQPFFGGGTQIINGGNDNRNTFNRARLGYYGRVTYNYLEKYLVEFMWRRDGSSFNPPDRRFGFFPGILVGWNISNEEFFSENLRFVNFLKLRASYGQMGNDQLFRINTDGTVTDFPMEYAYLSNYSPGEYPINGQVVKTLMERLVRNNNFTWEESNNLNIGLEGAVFNNSIDFTVEYFLNKRSQMLIYNFGTTPSSSGILDKLPPVNGGRMENKGFEFTLGYNTRVSDINFRVSANAGYNKNKVLYMNEITAAPSYQWQTGHPWGAYLAYQSDGVFRDQAEIDAEELDYTGVTNKLLPGDLKLIDYNKDGKINADDKVRMDKTRTPNFNYGIQLNVEYKNFDLSILFQGAMGALLRFGTESGDIGNYLKYSHDNRWSIDNPSTEHPRLAIRNDTWYSGGEYSNNTYNLFNKNYLRLKNVELGYNVPVSISQRLAVSSLRVYVNGLNLITWDKYKIFDPEADNAGLQYYPQARVINTGVRLTF